MPNPPPSSDVAAQPKTSKTLEMLGWLGVGVFTDYFIFKPAEKIRKFRWIGIGFIIGVCYTYGIDNLINGLFG